ncbi:hypothetical protein MANES_06G101100v8 [Manihot esculenta]|uniref:Uncharacterized protein n=1 Tax=Manihot esculenta TaxID=3983 RepID=A0ACB7HJ55_MANES|nr:hypothetical protein MANES_06G101100v8 [Manihot esculenta]
MQKSRKRKQQLRLKPGESETKPAKISIPTKHDPYPTHPRPTPEECLAVRDSLLACHGFPQEFAKYREQRRNLSSLVIDTDAQNGVKSETLDTGEESVLDGLIKTLLSQNTTEVHAAESKCIEHAIRCGGLAPKKASCIKNILSCLLEKKGKLCLEYLRDLSVEEIKAELSHFKGVGPKTVSCVLLFQLQLDDFPVDTHVFEIAKAIGWVPEGADRNKTYLHLNQRIPNELKFDLNCLLFTHGKLCRKCTKKGGNQQSKESCDNSCPLLNYRVNL